MGLDSVELVLRLEDEFSISITDDEAAATRTVGDVYNLILSKLDVTPGCLSSKAFYFTRRALVECLGLPRRSIRPATPLAPLLPEETRQKQWRQIVERIGLMVPPLRLPDEPKQRYYKRSMAGSGVSTVMLAIVALSAGWSAPLVFFLAIIFWIGLTAACFGLMKTLLRSLVNELPADTAGELARVVLSLNYDHFASPVTQQKPSSDDVWQRVVDIFCDQLQIDRKEVVPNAKIVDDLGVC
jgi:acyl carrier protein